MRFLPAALLRKALTPPSPVRVCICTRVCADNHCYNNGDAGMAMLESSNANISGNVFENNKYGIRMSVGCEGNLVKDNTFRNTSQ